MIFYVDKKSNGKSNLNYRYILLESDNWDDYSDKEMNEIQKLQSIIFRIFTAFQIVL